MKRIDFFLEPVFTVEVVVKINPKRKKIHFFKFMLTFGGVIKVKHIFWNKYLFEFAAEFKI